MLRARYRLGLLSNGSRLPEKVGLAMYFESVVFAQDHRVAKPDKGIFEVVEAKVLKVSDAVCVLVGDHPLNVRGGGETRPAGPPCGSTATGGGDVPERRRGARRRRDLARRASRGTRQARPQLSSAGRDGALSTLAAKDPDPVPLRPDEVPVGAA